MHVGGLLEFRKPPGAPRDYLKREYERIREEHRIPRPWNLKLIRPPGIGPRLPLMREDPGIDVHYHVRHSALPYPGGERELGVLVARLHSNPLDLHRPLWEMHLIEGLGEDGFAVYLKVHHSLIDGISAMRMMLRTLSTDPEVSTPAFWSVGEGSRPDHHREADSGRRPARRPGRLRAGPDRGRSRTRRGAPPARCVSRSRQPVDRSLQRPGLGARRADRGPAAVHRDGGRARAPRGARRGLRRDRQRHRPVPELERPAPLPARARLASLPGAHRRDPGQPAGSRRREHRDRRRDGLHRPRHQLRRSARAAAGDPGLDGRGKDPSPAPAPGRPDAPTR